MLKVLKKSVFCSLTSYNLIMMMNDDDDEGSGRKQTLQRKNIKTVIIVINK